MEKEITKKVNAEGQTEYYCQEGDKISVYEENLINIVDRAFTELSGCVDALITETGNESSMAYTCESLLEHWRGRIDEAVDTIESHIGRIRIDYPMRPSIFGCGEPLGASLIPKEN